MTKKYKEATDGKKLKPYDLMLFTNLMMSARPSPPHTHALTNILFIHFHHLPHTPLRRKFCPGHFFKVPSLKSKD